MSTRKTILKQILWSLCAVALLASTGITQSLKNKGTILNPSGKTISVKNLINGVGGTGGTIRNSGQITVASNGAFYNNDSSGAGSGYNSSPGIVRNFWGQGGGAGTITAPRFFNGTGTFTNDSTWVALSGVLNVTDTLQNATASNFSTSIGTVSYNGLGSVNSAILNSKYGVLKINSTGTVAIAGTGVTVVVDSTLNLTAGTLSENGNNLTLNSTVTSATGTLKADGSGSTTTYASTLAQNVLGANYYNLAVSNGNTKTAQGGVTVVTGGSLNVAASTTFDLGAVANGLTLNPTLTTAVSNTGTIKTQGTVSFGADYTIGGTFEYYNSTTSQTLGAANYANLTLSGGSGATGQKNLPTTGTVGVSGTYTVGGANRSYTSSTFAYNGSGNQGVVAGESYNNLTITTPTAVAGDTTVLKTVNSGSGTLTVGGALNITAGTLDIVAYSGTPTFATSSLAGIARIRWWGSNVFVPGTGITDLAGTAGGTIANNAGGANSYGNLVLGGGNWAIATGGTNSVTVTGGTYASIGMHVTSGATLTVNNGASLTVTSLDLNNDGTITNNGTVTVN